MTDRAITLTITLKQLPTINPNSNHRCCFEGPAYSDVLHSLARMFTYAYEFPEGTHTLSNSEFTIATTETHGDY